MRSGDDVRCGRFSARRSLAFAAALVAAFVHASDARADRFVTLRWTAPAECPAKAAVEAEIARLLATTKNEPPQPLDAAATVTHVGDAYRLHLEIARGGSPSARDVRGSTCRAVADAAALIVAMAIDPEAASAAGPPAAAPPASPAPTPEAPPPAGPTAAPASPSGSAAPPASPPPPPAAAPRVAAAAPVAPTPARSSQPDTVTQPGRAPEKPANAPPRRWRISAAAIADYGTLQNASFAGELAAGGIFGPLRIDAGAAFWPPHSATAEGSPNAGASLDLVAGSAALCGAIPPLAAGRQAFELALPCIGAELGRMHGTGYGVEQPSEGESFWAALRGGASGTWVAAPWLGVRLRLEAVVPLVRPRFLLGGVGTVHEPGVSGRAALGLELRL